MNEEAYRDGSGTDLWIGSDRIWHLELRMRSANVWDMTAWLLNEQTQTSWPHSHSGGGPSFCRSSGVFIKSGDGGEDHCWQYWLPMLRSSWVAMCVQGYVYRHSAPDCHNPWSALRTWVFALQSIKVYTYPVVNRLSNVSQLFDSFMKTCMGLSETKWDRFEYSNQFWHILGTCQPARHDHCYYLFSNSDDPIGSNTTLSNIASHNLVASEARCAASCTFSA